MTFFSFGCSFTNYSWPTWADIVGREFESYQNWGQGGGGNQFIFHSLMECVAKNIISQDDTVGIMWTNVTREDRYVQNKWLTPGNIFTQDTYDKQFVNDFADIRGYFLRDLNIVLATRKILDSIGCNFFFLSMVPLTNAFQYQLVQHNDKIQDIVENFESELKHVRTSVFESIFNFDWTSRPLPYENFDPIDRKQRLYNIIKDSTWPNWDISISDHIGWIGLLPEKIKKECFDNFNLDLYNPLQPLQERLDLHPTPMEHLQYIEKVLPEITISTATKDWVLSVDNDVVYKNFKWEESPNTAKRW